MNPLVLLTLLAASCAAAPGVLLHGAALPLGDVVPVAAPLAHVAVPGYTVNGEIRTVDNIELKDVPLVAHTGVIAHHGLIGAPLAIAPAVVKAEEGEAKPVAVLPTLAGLPTLHHAGLPALHHVGLPVGYHGLGLGLHGLPLIAAAEPAAEEAA